MSVASIRLAEWTRLGPVEHTALRGRVLSPEARDLAADLERTRALRIRELRTGIEIETRSFVGSLVLDDLRIDIVPKIGIPRLMRMVARSYGLGDLTILDDALAQGVAEAGFVDLLAHTLLAETRRLARRGLLQDYVMRDEVVSTPRGRIDLRQWACAPSSTTIECRFEAFTPDHELHRTVKAGLHMAAGLARDRHLQFDLGRAAERFFPDVGSQRLTRSLLLGARSGITRRTSGYRRALTLIGILLDGKSVEIERAGDRVRVPAFLLDMNRLFERFLERELARRMPPLFRIRRQTQDHGAFRWEDNPRHRRAPEIRPDLVFMRGQRTIAVADAKYKDYDSRPVSTSDLFQVTTYAYACGAEDAVPVMILYPTLRNSLMASGDLRFAGLRGRAPVQISILGLPVARVLDDAQYDLWHDVSGRLAGNIPAG